MEDKLCYESIAGFCLRENFASEFTQICKKIHDKGREDVYDHNKVYDTDIGIYREYEKVLNEINCKIENNLIMIQSFTEYCVTKKDISVSQLEETAQNRINSIISSNDTDIPHSISERNINQTNIQEMDHLNIRKENDSNSIQEDRKIQFSLSDITNLLFQLNNDFTFALKNNQDIDSLLVFHQYYARCLTVYNKKSQTITLNVCLVCSHVYEQKCEHPFHEKYEKLRAITQQMKNKLKIDC